jgi:hypothetical protein
MECAMTMLRTDLWSKTNVIRPFKWFSSENGAFMSESCSVMIFKEAMRITNATWENGIASFNTNTHLTVNSSPKEVLSFKTSNYCSDTIVLTSGLVVESWDGRSAHERRLHYYKDGRRLGCMNSN